MMSYTVLHSLIPISCYCYRYCLCALEPQRSLAITPPPMAPRPLVELGGWVQTIDHRTIRCKAYDGPPGIGRGGNFIKVFKPGTFLGPINQIVRSWEFETIEVDGWWINIWGMRRGTGTVYAVPVSDDAGYWW